MDQLFTLLASLLEDERLLGFAFMGLIGAAVFAVCLAGMLLVGGLSDPVRQRLKEMGAGKGAVRSQQARLAELVEPVSAYVLPSKEEERSKIRDKLIQSGFRTSAALTVFYAVKTLLALLLPMLAMGVLALVPGTETSRLIISALLASGVGVSMPNFILNRLWERRQKRLRNALPDALDLLVVCTEAGLGLKQALQRVADELAVAHPDLAEELGMVNAEMRVGIERTDALRGLAYRTGLEDIRGLVSLISQSMRFGTSVADALRVYAEEFRDKRMQKAEEEAAKIGTKMIFPLVLCLFPAFFVVAVGPAVLGAVAALSGRG
jgi:tight adherence protein C